MAQVLGAGSRKTLARNAQWLTLASVVASVVVPLMDKGTERVALLLVVFAIVSVVVAYLSTMGFGAIQMRVGPKPTEKT